MLQAVRAAEVSLLAVLRDLDPDAVPLCEVPELWKAFNSIETLAATAKTLLASRFEAGDSWRKAGYKSAADQLASLAGTSVKAARTQLQTSKRVKNLPKTAHAMRKGKLSPAKVDAIADAANVDPEAEDDLLDGAEKKPLGELREACLKAKAKDRDRAHARIYRNRSAREFKDTEGAWNLYARGTLDAGSDFRLEWRRLIDEQFKLAKAEGRDEPLEAYAFDALMELAKRSARADSGPAPGGGDPATTKTKKPPRTPARYRGIIRLDYETLVRGREEESTYRTSPTSDDHPT